MENEQAVANADVESTETSTEESGAQENLDGLLNEYEVQTGGEQTTEPKNENSKIDYIYNRFQAEDAEKIKTQTNEDIGKAVEIIRDENLNLPDKAYRGMLLDKAEEDVRFLQAFQQRGQNPGQWNKVLKAFQKEILSDFKSLPDKEATADREAVLSAVHSASTKQPLPDAAPDLNSMSNQDFAKHKAEILRQSRK